MKRTFELQVGMSQESATRTRTTDPEPPSVSETTLEPSGPETVFRKVLASGVFVELVQTEGYPLVLIVGHPEAGRLAVDVTWDDVSEVAQALNEGILRNGA